MSAPALTPPATVTETLAQLIASKGSAIEGWLKATYQGKCPPFYLSLDIRHAGYKIAPVDSNLFPAGFNNLSTEERALATNQVKVLLEKHFGGCGTVLIYPEKHTRNTYYTENLSILVDIITSAGACVRLGTELPSYSIESVSGKVLQVEELKKENGEVKFTDGTTPALIVLNNDLTGGIPDILKETKQSVLPSPKLGWHTRRKSAHFTAYNMLVHEFAAEFGIDPWLISTFSGTCGEVDFKEKVGLDCVAENISNMLPKIQKKYDAFGIQEPPYIYIKSDYGTYGMGIMTVQKPEDIYEINKKERNKMSMVKGNVENHAVMVQEGVPTIDAIAGQPAEAVLYCMGGEPLGHFFRTHSAKDAYGSLNSPGGMEFVSSREKPELFTKEYRAACDLIARLVNIAVTREVY